MRKQPGEGGGEFAGYVCMYVRAAALSEPLPHYSLFCGQSIIDPILATFGQICNFSRSQIRHSLFLWIDPFFRIKNTSPFIYSSNILVRLLTVNMKNCLTSKNPKMCDPILVTLLKMRPYYSQSSRENATPSSGTSLVASYKEVPPGINNSLVACKQIPPLLLF